MWARVKNLLGLSWGLLHFCKFYTSRSPIKVPQLRSEKNLFILQTHREKKWPFFNKPREEVTILRWISSVLFSLTTLTYLNKRLWRKLLYHGFVDCIHKVFETSQIYRGESSWQKTIRGKITSSQPWGASVPMETKQYLPHVSSFIQHQHYSTFMKITCVLY